VDMADALCIMYDCMLYMGAWWAWELRMQAVSKGKAWGASRLWAT